MMQAGLKALMMQFSVSLSIWFGSGGLVQGPTLRHGSSAANNIIEVVLPCIDPVVCLCWLMLMRQHASCCLGR